MCTYVGRHGSTSFVKLFIQNPFFLLCLSIRVQLQQNLANVIEKHEKEICEFLHSFQLWVIRLNDDR